MLASVRILLILAAVGVAWFTLKNFTQKLEDRLIRRSEKEGEPASEAQKRINTLFKLMRQAVLILIWVIAGLVILRELGVDITPIIASVGVVGLAVGFGAQNLVRDVISGFFLILENQVRVGDVVAVNGTGGLVEKMNFRTIVLRDANGVVHVFPNGAINTLSNSTRDWSGYIFEVGVGYKEDVDRVIGVMHQTGVELRADKKFGAMMVDNVEIWGVDDFAASAVIIKGRIKAKPSKQWDVGREYRKRLLKVFKSEGIEMPFPQRSLHFDDKSAKALAALLKTKSKKKS